MTKQRLTKEDMEMIEQMVSEQKEQRELLKDILLAIKGDESLNVEGVVQATKRIDNKLNEIEKTLVQINLWKDIITSKRFWRFLIFFVGFIAIGFLMAKYGFLVVWEYVKKLVL
jgi:hypothetical protein